MIDHPLVSVLIPSYNHEQYIAESIKSVLDQNYPNIQLIVIDDGSVDESCNIIQKIREQYQFIFLRQPNMGVTRTLNFALRNLVNGKYFRLIASDDMLTPESISKQVEFMEANPRFGLSFGKVYKMNNNSDITGYIIPKNLSGYLYKEYLLGRLKFNITSVMYRFDKIVEAGFYDESISTEDIYMNGIFFRNYEVAFLDEFLSYYRQHSSNTTRKTWLMYSEAKKVFFKLHGDAPFFDKALRLKSLQWFYLLAESYKKEALKYFRLAMFYWYDKMFIAGVLRLLFTRELKK